MLACLFISITKKETKFHGCFMEFWVQFLKKKKKSSSLINLQILDKIFGFVCSNDSWATVTTTSNIISLLKFKP